MVKRCTTVFSGVQGAPYYSNFFFEDAATAAQIVAATDEFWDTVDTLIVNTCSWTTLGEVVQLDEATGVIVGITNTSGSNGVGASSVEMLPPSTQGLVQWGTNTFIGGRRIRGRTFIPALNESVNDGGVMASASRTILLGAANALIGDAFTDFVVYSRTHQQIATIASASTWEQFAQLRSRRD